MAKRRRSPRRAARRSRRTLTILLVLVLVSITVISLDESGRTHGLTSGVKSVATDAFSPVRSGVDAVLRPVGDLFAGAVNYGSLQQENQKLRAEIGALRQQAAEAPFQSRQQRQLQQLLARGPAAHSGLAVDGPRPDHRQEPLGLHSHHHHRQGARPGGGGDRPRDRRGRAGGQGRPGQPRHRHSAAHHRRPVRGGRHIRQPARSTRWPPARGRGSCCRASTSRRPPRCTWARRCTPTAWPGRPSPRGSRWPR